MRGQKGFSLVELLVVIAILEVIAFVAVTNIGPYLQDVDPSSDAAIFTELRGRPMSSLNMTELQFVVDYYISHGSTAWAAVYQNQIIIMKLDELLQTEVKQ